MPRSGFAFAFEGSGENGCVRPVHASRERQFPVRLRHGCYPIRSSGARLGGEYGMHRPLRSVSRAPKRHGFAIALGALADARFLRRAKHGACRIPASEHAVQAMESSRVFGVWTVRAESPRRFSECRGSRHGKRPRFVVAPASASVAAAFPIDRQQGRLPRRPLSPTRRTAMPERRCAWSEERRSRRTKADQKKAKVRISMLSRGGASGRAAGSVKALCAVKRARPSVAES